jgi:hypothetical protein
VIAYRERKRLEVLAAADLGNVIRDDEDGHDYENHGDGRRRVTTFVDELREAGWLRLDKATRLHRPTETGLAVLERAEPAPTARAEPSPITQAQAS